MSRLMNQLMSLCRVIRINCLLIIILTLFRHDENISTNNVPQFPIRAGVLFILITIIYLNQLRLSQLFQSEAHANKGN